jgi:hypothetical protein
MIKIGLDALAEDYGYALAGGYAVQAHRIVDRLSDDVGLFAPIDRATGEIRQQPCPRRSPPTKPPGTRWRSYIRYPPTHG